MPKITTSNRMFFLTPKEYGEDDLLIEEMSGQEGVSKLFEFRLKLLSERDDIKPENKTVLNIHILIAFIF